MSSAGQVGGSGEAPKQPITPELQFSCAKKRNGKWVHASLDAKGKEIVKKAISEIEAHSSQLLSSQEMGSTLYLKKGKVLKGIDTPEGEDETALYGERLAVNENVQKVLEHSLNELGKAYKVDGSEVLITINFAPPNPATALTEAISNQGAFNQRIQKINEFLNDDKKVEKLPDHLKENIKDIRKAYKELQAQSNSIYNALVEAYYSLRELKMGESPKYVMDNLAYSLKKCYPSLSKAIRDVEKYERALGSVSTSLTIGLESADSQGAMLESIFKKTEEYLSYQQVTFDNTEWNEAIGTIKNELKEVAKSRIPSDYIPEMGRTIIESREALHELENLSRLINPPTAFYAHCKKAGYSELDITYIFSHIEKAYNCSKAVQTDLERIQGLILIEKNDEALQAYANLLNAQHYKEYVQSINQLQSVEPLVKSLGQTFSDTVQAFDSARGGKWAAGDTLLAKLDYVRQTPSTLHQHFSNLVEIYEETGTPAPNWKTTAHNKILSSSDIKRETVLTSKTLDDFKNIQANTEVSKYLKNHKISEGDFKEFLRINHAYEKATFPLQRGMELIENESDPEKKRALQSQVRRYAEEIAPQLNKLRDQFIKWGGREKLLGIRQALAEIKGHQDKYLQDLKSLYDKQNILTTPLPPFENLLTATLSDTDAFTFRNTVKSLENNKALQENLTHVELSLSDFEKTTDFLNSTFDKLALRMNAKEPVLFDVLATNNRIAQHPDFKAELGKNGCSIKDLDTVLTYYFDYSKMLEPLYLAHKALEQDPHNPNLIKNLRDVEGKVIANLNKLNRAFREKGGKPLVNKVQNSIEAFKGYLQKQVEANLDVSKTPTYKADLEELNKLPNLVELINQNDNFVAALDERLESKFSAEKGFLGEIVDSFKASFFDPSWKKHLDSLWEGDLTEKKLTIKAVKELATIVEDLDEILAPLYALQREHEADPANITSYKKLMEEKARNFDKIATIMERYENWPGDKKSFQSAITSHLATLDKVIDRFKVDDAALSTTESEDRKKSEDLKKQIEECERRKRLLEKLDIQEIFKVRNDFLAKLYPER